MGNLQASIVELKAQHSIELVEEYNAGYAKAVTIYKAKLTITGTYEGVAFSTEYDNASEAYQAGFNNGVYSLTEAVNSLTHERDQLQAEDGIRDLVRSRGLGDVYKRQCLKNIMLAMQKQSQSIKQN